MERIRSTTQLNSQFKALNSTELNSQLNSAEPIPQPDSAQLTTELNPAHYSISFSPRVCGEHENATL